MSEVGLENTWSLTRDSTYSRCIGSFYSFSLVFLQKIGTPSTCMRPTLPSDPPTRDLASQRRTACSHAVRQLRLIISTLQPFALMSRTGSRQEQIQKHKQRFRRLREYLHNVAVVHMTQPATWRDSIGLTLLVVDQ